jgi:hypothetical protein
MGGMGGGQYQGQGQYQGGGVTGPYQGGMGGPYQGQGQGQYHGGSMGGPYQGGGVGGAGFADSGAGEEDRQAAVNDRADALISMPGLEDGMREAFLSLSLSVLTEAAVRRTSAAAAWAGRFPFTDRIEAALRRVFNLTGFRPLQREIISAVMSGRDVFALLPTGGGKSLCYQLPAIVNDGLTLVVSPLISLIQDQVSQLRFVMRIDARQLGGANDAEAQECYRGAASGI